MKKKRNLIGVCLVAVLMLALTVIGYAAGDGEAAPEYGAWCLVPPLVTIVLAFVTKQTIISMFIGDELQGILDAIESDADYTDVDKTKMNLGASVLPAIPKDTTDRNRTSPFAFTGNKFEFRSLGSSVNIA